MRTSESELTEAFEKLYRQISEESFLSMTRGGNEVPFFISTHDPVDHYAVESHINALTNRLRSKGIGVCTVNLYDLCMGLLKDADVFEAVIEVELEQSKEELQEGIANALDMNQVLLPAIKAEFDAEPDAKVNFVRQLGQVYPYIRAHSLMSNLQAVAKTRPTVFFYPGMYDNKKMSLFDKLRSDNHYRATNLDQMPG